MNKIHTALHSDPSGPAELEVELEVLGELLLLVRRHALPERRKSIKDQIGSLCDKFSTEYDH